MVALGEGQIKVSLLDGSAARVTLEPFHLPPLRAVVCWVCPADNRAIATTAAVV